MSVEFLKICEYYKISILGPPLDHRAKLTTTLSDLSKMPVEFDHEVAKSLSYAAFVGESSMEQLLHDALADALRKEFPGLDYSAKVDEDKEPVNPTYAA